MAAEGVPPHIIERVLNHRSGTIEGVAAVYNRFQYQEECRQALAKWAEKIASLTQIPATK